MKTKNLKLTADNREEILKEAGEVILSGGLVVFPTETVYGLGANALNESAVQKIFLAKGRPSDNPIILHIGDESWLDDLVESVSGTQQKLIDAFWPGPLTLIFKKKENVSSIVSGGLDTIAIRMPKNSFALDLLKKVGVPIGAPSANISGKPSATDANTAFADLSGQVSLIVDDGFSNIGLESTVVKEDNENILILRAGSVTKEMIEGVVSKPVFFATKKEDLNSSPGTKYRHYAPKAKLQIIAGDSENIGENLLKIANENLKNGIRVGILGTVENMNIYKGFEPNVFSLGSKNDMLQISRNVYRGLRFFDDKDVDLILVEAFEEKDLGVAVMDRFKKASAV
ncbi:MAG: threonylcarbamoyl-AMP synthase [Candidatus Pacebacteria bacterium]|nr:threonylcarbamoyl-AMP synthase [Candidatus Paceibacterota bacterium]MCF7862467.1 threonylcarbamoyl-AMP synthase [Candidatus Paceibacterota bacterium]